ncbi:MAG: glycosyltransferase family 39 protein [Eubacteriales bacterium]|nr:glycosyltransferase family 39 protein [Eubacteriales bacterium]
MKKQETARRELLYMGIMYLALLGFKLVFVIGNRSFPIISDEYNYEYMSWQLVQSGIYTSAHYPFLYPLALTPAHLFGENSYLVMKILNAVYSSFVPVVTYKICRLYVEEKPSLVCAVFSMVIPFQYILTMCLMSENIYFPLFLLAIYLTLKPYQKKWQEDVAIAVSLGVLMLTRHITVSIIPVFAVVWIMKQLNKEETWGKIFARGFGIVAMILVVYSPWFISKYLQGHEIKTIIGLSIASGSDPEALTVKRLIKSLAYYLFYTALMLAPLLGVLVKSIRGLDVRKKERCSEYNQLWVLVVGLMFMMLVAVTRHSWKASYNYPAFTKIKGRYVIYFPVLAAILAVVVLFQKKPKFKHNWCNLLFCYAFPAAVLWVSYRVEVARDTAISVKNLIDMFDSIDGRRAVYGGKWFLVVAMAAMLLILIAYDYGRKKLNRYFTGTVCVCLLAGELAGAGKYYQAAVKLDQSYVEEGGTIAYLWDVMDTLEAIDTGEKTYVYMEKGVRRRDIVEWVPKYQRLLNFVMVEEQSAVSKDVEYYYILTTEPEKYEDILIEEVDQYTMSNTDMWMLKVENTLE